MSRGWVGGIPCGRSGLTFQRAVLSILAEGSGAATGTILSSSLCIHQDGTVIFLRVSSFPKKLDTAVCALAPPIILAPPLSMAP